MQQMCDNNMTITPPITIDHLHKAKQIKYIFDCDGFSIDGEFHVKEVAIGNLDTGEINLYHFQLPKLYNQLTGKLKYQVRWLTNNIHGLRYENDHSDLPINEMSIKIQTACVDADLNKRTIGYKGGHIEYDILKRLKYSHLAVNIEIFGCPRFDILYTTLNLNKTSPLFNSCIQCHKHVKAKNPNKKLAHCSRVEVVYFMNFIYNFINTYNSLNY